PHFHCGWVAGVAVFGDVLYPWVSGDHDGDVLSGRPAGVAAPPLGAGARPPPPPYGPGPRASGSWPSTDRPPSTGTVAPLTKLASSASSQATAAATSWGRPMRPTGCSRPSSSSIRAAAVGSWRPGDAWERAGAGEPSATALTRMPRGP